MVYLGDFTPDKVYVLADGGHSFQITEEITVPNDDEMINLVAMGLDKNEKDYYTFHMSYPNGQDWEQVFMQFITEF